MNNREKELEEQIKAKDAEIKELKTALNVREAVDEENLALREKIRALEAENQTLHYKTT